MQTIIHYVPVMEGGDIEEVCDVHALSRPGQSQSTQYLTLTGHSVVTKCREDAPAIKITTDCKIHRINLVSTTYWKCRPLDVMCTAAHPFLNTHNKL